jgi:RHS repeat-associated protein
VSWKVEQSRSYYGADEKLRVVDRRVCNYGSETQGGATVCLEPSSHQRPTFEEYRYDALGRRVLTRTDQTFACSANCIDGITRTVWDGDQVLYEIRRPMASAETETGVVPDGTSNPHQYGRVGYTHGGGLDKPLAIYRMDYDTMFPAAQLLAPHTDARGAYEAGTHSVTGMSMPCKTMPRTVVDATPYPSDDPENPPSPHADSVQVCVKVDFPAAKQWMTYSPRNTSHLGAYAWWGSLISGSRDASGQMYMRNRYYDPTSGRFTQEDPIGLAGGLNLYGFAGGDPVNFNDPYGLRLCVNGRRGATTMQQVVRNAHRLLAAAGVATNMRIRFRPQGAGILCVTDATPLTRDSRYSALQRRLQMMIASTETYTIASTLARSEWREDSRTAFISLTDAGSFIQSCGGSSLKATDASLVVHELLGHGTQGSFRGSFVGRLLGLNETYATEVENEYHVASSGQTRCRGTGVERP